MGNQNPWMFKYEFQIYEVPAHMREGVKRYIHTRTRPGSFLQAVISNNLKEAVMLADGKNMFNLPAYINYFYNHAPHDCWGSEKEMEAWIKGGDK